MQLCHKGQLPCWICCCSPPAPGASTSALRAPTATASAGSAPLYALASLFLEADPALLLQLLLPLLTILLHPLLLLLLLLLLILFPSVTTSSTPTPAVPAPPAPASFVVIVASLGKVQFP